MHPRTHRYVAQVATCACSRQPASSACAVSGRVSEGAATMAPINAPSARRRDSMATSQVLQCVASDHTHHGSRSDCAQERRLLNPTGANPEKNRKEVETAKPAQHTTSWCHCSALLHAESAGKEAVMGWGAVIECVDAIRLPGHSNTTVGMSTTTGGQGASHPLTALLPKPNKQVGGMHGSKHCKHVHAGDGMSTGCDGC